MWDWHALQPRWAQRMERRIMSALDDQLQTLTDALTAIGASVDTISPEVTKVGTETTSLLQKIIELQSNPPSGITPEQQAVLSAAVVQAQSIVTSVGNIANAVKAVDDLVPDAG